MSTFGKELIASACEALAIAEGRAEPSRSYVPPSIDVAALRHKTRMTQDCFARTYRIPIGTLRDWEQGRRMPDQPARALLAIIDAAPQAIAEMLGSNGGIATTDKVKKRAAEPKALRATGPA